MPLLKVDVVTAEERLYEGTAKFVVVPGTEGELGILPGHERLLTRMRPGTVRLTQENDEEVILFVAGGFVDVQPEQVIVLADTAVRARDLDEAKAQQARKAAEELMQNSHSKIDYARAQAELAEAVAQLAAIERCASAGAEISSPGRHIDSIVSSRTRRGSERRPRSV